MKNFTGLLTALFVFFLTLVGLFYMFEHYQAKKVVDLPTMANWNAEKTFNILYDGRSSPDPTMEGNPWAPNSVVSAKSTYGGETIYEVIYKFDNFALRETPRKHSDINAKHAIVAGCSYVFGEGLNVEHTLPYLIEMEAPDYNVYNLGFIGGGLSHIFRFIETGKLAPAISENEGHFIYVFMFDHLTRFFVRPDYMSWADERIPYYVYDNNEVHYKGQLSDQDFFQNFQKLYKTGLKHSVLHAASAMENSNTWSDKELKEFSLALQILEKRYLKIFPKGKFSVVFHPLWSGDNQLMFSLIKHIHELGIKVLNPYVDFYPLLAPDHYSDANYRIKNDGHPNAQTNRYFSRWIIDNVLK